MTTTTYIAKITDPASGESKAVSVGDVYDDVQVWFPGKMSFDYEFKHLEQHAADEDLEYEAWRVEIDVESRKIVSWRTY